MEPSLDEVFDFTKLMLVFQSVERWVGVPGRSARENDAEHSFQLAMMAWYLVEAGDLALDLEKVFRYALSHDLPEAYAYGPQGVDVHVLDHVGREQKARLEAAAIGRIANELPEFPGLVNSIRDYAEHDEPESRFVYALDKLMPMLIIYLDDGQIWQQLNFSLEELMANKSEKTSGDVLVHWLSNELEALIRERPELFPLP